MTAPARTRLAVDERRAQLLELGVRLFSERSYDGVSIDDIARAAGISKGLLYHYFGGKRAFYAACVQHAADALAARVETDPTLPPNERARRGLEAYLDFVAEREGAYVALMRSGVGTDPEVAATLERTRAQIVERMLETIGPGARPLFRLAVRSWIGQVEAACLDWLEHRDVERSPLVRMLLMSLFATLSAASSMDPEAALALPLTPLATDAPKDDPGAGSS